MYFNQLQFYHNETPYKELDFFFRIYTKSRLRKLEFQTYSVSNTPSSTPASGRRGNTGKGKAMTDSQILGSHSIASNFVYDTTHYLTWYDAHKDEHEPCSRFQKC